MKSKVFQLKDLFLTTKKNWKGMYNLFYKKKYYDKALIMTIYLLECLYDLNRDKVLTIFSLFNQD